MAVTEAEAIAPLKRLQSGPKSASVKPEKRRPGRSPKDPISLEQADFSSPA
jgi:hypothetical protein